MPNQLMMLHLLVSMTQPQTRQQHCQQQLLTHMLMHPLQVRRQAAAPVLMLAAVVVVVGASSSDLLQLLLTVVVAAVAGSLGHQQLMPVMTAVVVAAVAHAAAATREARVGAADEQRQHQRQHAEPLLTVAVTMHLSCLQCCSLQAVGCWVRRNSLQRLSAPAWMVTGTLRSVC